jgi:transcription antitermination factor NusG
MKKWYVLYTKPRNEKKVAERLSLAGYEMYCPLIRTLKQWSDRKKHVSVPMFPSYIFIRIEEAARKDVLRDQGILNYVFWLGKPAVIRDNEIEAIKRIEAQGSEIKVEGGKPEKGQMVEIPEGPFKGMIGRVDKVDRTRVLLYIEQLGCIVQFKYS